MTQTSSAQANEPAVSPRHHAPWRRDGLPASGSGFKRSFTGQGLSSLLLLLMVCDLYAAPALRDQRILRGGFTIVGNTLAQDCGPVAAPVTPFGPCGSNTLDTAPDVFWVSDAPEVGQATGNTSIPPSLARTTAVLSVPADAEVVSARLYWSSRTPAGGIDTVVNLERVGQFSTEITADASQSQFSGATYFLSSADVTSTVAQFGSGTYRVSGIDVVNLLNLNDSAIYAGWWMVVIYRQATMPLIQISLFDGLDFVSAGVPTEGTVSGFLVPSVATGSIGIVAVEGDNLTTGDAFQFNGSVLSDAVRPAGNFFNSSRTNFGSAVSVVGDLPQFTGVASSYSGLDMAVADISANLSAGQSFATFGATSSADVFALTTVVTAIATVAPEFSGAVLNAAVNLSGRPLLESRVGDTLEFTVSVTNVGSDTAVASALESLLDPALQYVPGSLAIVSGPNAGNLTDASGDDQAEFQAGGTRTVQFRLGTGADAMNGGQLAQNAATSIRYRATLASPLSAIGTSVATMQAAGLLGAPLQSTASNTVQFNSDELLKDSFE